MTKSAGIKGGGHQRVLDRSKEVTRRTGDISFKQARSTGELLDNLPIRLSGRQCRNYSLIGRGQIRQSLSLLSVKPIGHVDHVSLRAF